MIVDGKLSVPRVIVNLGKPLLLTFLISVIVTLAYTTNEPKWLFGTVRPYLSISATPLTVIGAALSIFLAFRNNTVYDRWWEGRILWGAMVNYSRTFARQLVTFGAYSSEHGDKEALRAWQREMVMRHLAFLHAFRHHLRDDDPLLASGVEPYVSAEELAYYGDRRNVPSAVLFRQGERLHDAWRRGWIGDFHLNTLDATVTELTNILGGCERIKNTPLPPVYTYLAYRIVVAFCCIVPFGLVKDLVWFTPVVSLLISFAFLVLNRISQLIELPFSTRVNDLPLTTLCRVIEIDLRQHLDIAPVPDPIKPVDGVLL